MRTNMFRRILAFTLLMTLLLGLMSVTASALALPEQDWDEGKLEVVLVKDREPDDIAKPKEPDTIDVSIYNLVKVFTGANDAGLYEPEDPEYIWANDALGAWVAGYNANFSVKASSPDGMHYNVMPAIEKLTAKEAEAFYDALEAALEQNGGWGLTPITKTAVWTENTTECSVTFEDLKMGVYLVTAKNARAVYKPTVAGIDPNYTDEDTDTYEVEATQTVELKGSSITISKKIQNTKYTDHITTSEVDADEPVSYKIEMNVPKYPDSTAWGTDANPAKTYEIHDVMTAQDLLPSTLKLLINGVDKTQDLEVERIRIEAETDNGSKSWYLSELKQEENKDALKDCKSIEIIVDLNGKSMYDSYLRGAAKIILSYDAALNNNAVLIDSTVEHPAANENTASLIYANNPYVPGAKKTLSDNDMVYTYGIQVEKVSAGDNPVLLEGAEFSLTMDGELLKFEKKNGWYVKDGKDESSTIIRTDGNGSILIKGLKEGTYILKETKAPLGYSMNTDEFEITIKDEEMFVIQDGVVTGTIAGKDGLPEIETDEGDLNQAKKEAAAAKGMVFQQVTNVKTFALPETGGIGTILYTLFGILLMAGGVLLIAIFIRRRKS